MAVFGLAESRVSPNNIHSRLLKTTQNRTYLLALLQVTHTRAYIKLTCISHGSFPQRRCTIFDTTTMHVALSNDTYAWKNVDSASHRKTFPQAVEHRLFGGTHGPKDIHMSSNAGSIAQYHFSHSPHEKTIVFAQDAYRYHCIDPPRNLRIRHSCGPQSRRHMRLLDSISDTQLLLT